MILMILVQCIAIKNLSEIQIYKSNQSFVIGTIKSKAKII